MTKDQVQRAFAACDAAFWRYVREATETHRLLSTLSGIVSVEQRTAVGSQRSRENKAQAIYLEARNVLFSVLAGL